MVYEIKNLSPRNEYLINNKYYILNNKNNDDFHLVINILNDKIKIIIRKMNNNEGWLNDLIIKIYDINEKKYELISIGSCDKNCKIINYKISNIKIVKKEPINQKITKTIIQTNKDRIIKEKELYESILTLIELNPDYEYKFFDNNECREFIKDNYDEKILYYYDKLIPGAFQADFFRYCYLYINGGCYFDCKNILKKPLSDIIKEDDDIILCQDIDEDCYYNSIILTEPNNNIFTKAIDLITNNIDNFDVLYDNYKTKVTKKKPFYGTLNITGPNLLYIACKNIINYEKNVRLRHFIDGNYKNYKNLKINYGNELFGLKHYHSCKDSDNHYNKLWIKKEIIYKYEFIFYDTKFLIYPNNFIKIDIEDNFLRINNLNNINTNIIKFKIIKNNNVYYKNYSTDKTIINFCDLLNIE